MCSVICVLISACASSNSIVQLEQSIRWYTGEAGYVDDDYARDLLEQSAQDGNPLSVMWLARVYSTGRMSYGTDKSKAVELATTVIDEIETLANSGDPQAMLLMGTAYAEGLAKAVNPERAVSWYRRAAERGNTLALHNMGNVYSSGAGVPQSDEQAVYWWRQAAVKGDAIPQLRLGSMYEQGKGVQPSIDQAVYWYSESAKRGNQSAVAALKRLELASE